MSCVFESRVTGCCALLRSTHKYMCAIGSEWEQEHLLFRDWLRHSYEDRRLHLDIKEALASLD